MRTFAYIVIFGIFAASGCQKLTRVISFERGGLIPSASMKITSVKPLVAKPGDTVTLTGENLGLQSQVKIGDAVVTLTDYDGKTARFVMPEMERPGAFQVTIGRQNDPTGTVETGAKFMISDSAGDSYPIYMATADEICSPVAFRDAEGELLVGTKECGSATADCVSDGEVGCKTTTSFPAVSRAMALPTTIVAGVTLGGVAGTFTGAFSNCASDGASSCVVDGTNYKAAAVANLSAANIKSGVTIAGQAGSVVAESHANCASDGQQSCVASGTFFAANACAANGSNCYLPTYSVSSQPLKAISYNSIDQTKMLDSLTVAGVTGTLSSRGTWNLTQTFPGAGYYSGVSNIPLASKIVSGNVITGVSGTATASPADCSSNGQQSCVATGSYFAGTACAANSSACYLPTYVASSQPLKAINYDAINSAASSIRTGTILGGVSGSLNDCAGDGLSGCVATAAYKTADMSNATAGNIKSGVTIAGITGQYPSATYTLPNATATKTDDLDTATFNAKIKASAVFEYWDSAGVRQSGAGDTDIDSTKIASGVDIFNTTGALTSPAPWDLRAGSSVISPNGTVIGKLKANCRNTANSALFNIGAGLSVSSITSGIFNVPGHGLAANDTVRINYSNTAPSGLNNSTTYYVMVIDANSFQLSATSGGTAIIAGGGSEVTVHKFGIGSVDIWDTIDDYNANATVTTTSGLPPDRVAVWSADTTCGGIDTQALLTDEDNVWKDVTTGGDCSPGTSANCSYQDKISGLQWSKNYGISKSWYQAVKSCDDLTHNGFSDWRLPTQKELMNAYEHGIRQTQSLSFAPNFHAYFWSGSTSSAGLAQAWTVYLSDGFTSQQNKTAIYNVICVRP